MSLSRRGGGEEDGVAAVDDAEASASAATPLGAGPLPLPVVRQAMHDLLSGLAFIHSRGVAHRDIKPDNLLLHSDGRLQLADFGEARLFVTPPPPPPLAPPLQAPPSVSASATLPASPIFLPSAEPPPPPPPALLQHASSAVGLLSALSQSLSLSDAASADATSDSLPADALFFGRAAPTPSPISSAATAAPATAAPSSVSPASSFMNHHSSLSAFSITAEEGGAHSFRLYGGDAAAGGTAAVPEGKGGDAGAPAFEPTSAAAAAAPATAEQSSSWVTDTRGTFMFLSPEACAGGGFDAYGADVWAAGVVMFSLLCGVLPFGRDAEGAMGLLDAIQNEELLPLPLHLASAPRGDDEQGGGGIASDAVAQSFLAGLLQKDPATRLTVAQALSHPFFTSAVAVAPPSLREPEDVTVTGVALDVGVSCGCGGAEGIASGLDVPPLAPPVPPVVRSAVAAASAIISSGSSGSGGSVVASRISGVEGTDHVRRVGVIGRRIVFPPLDIATLPPFVTPEMAVTAALSPLRSPLHSESAMPPISLSSDCVAAVGDGGGQTNSGAGTHADDSGVGGGGVVEAASTDGSTVGSGIHGGSGGNSRSDCRDIEGWLLKRGRRFKTWRRRYFVLRGDTLSYYDSPPSPPPPPAAASASSQQPLAIPPNSSTVAVVRGLEPQHVKQEEWTAASGRGRGGGGWVSRLFGGGTSASTNTTTRPTAGEAVINVGGVEGTNNHIDSTSAGPDGPIAELTAPRSVSAASDFSSRRSDSNDSGSDGVPLPPSPFSSPCDPPSLSGCGDSRSGCGSDASTVRQIVAARTSSLSTAVSCAPPVIGREASCLSIAPASTAAPVAPGAPVYILQQAVVADSLIVGPTAVQSSSHSGSQGDGGALLPPPPVLQPPPNHLAIPSSSANPSRQASASSSTGGSSSSSVVPATVVAAVPKSAPPVTLAMSEPAAAATTLGCVRLVAATLSRIPSRFSLSSSRSGDGGFPPPRMPPVMASAEASPPTTEAAAGFSPMVERARVLVRHAPKPGKPFRFYVDVEGRSLCLQAPSQDEMRRWMAAIEGAAAAGRSV